MDSYVVVDRADVVDAIGAFVAAYLATLPEAQHMQPKQLQQALKQAFQVALAYLLALAWGHTKPPARPYGLNPWHAGTSAEPHPAGLAVGPVHLPLRRCHLFSLQSLHESLVLPVAC